MHERGKIEVEVLYVLVEPPRGDLGIACGEVALFPFNCYGHWDTA